tara:strand:- start:118 stop:489 length:372 start_codon:yes stop_codon:yes gene_type:complete
MAKQSVAIGDLQFSVILQSRSKSTDAGGGYTSSWGTTRTLFASVKPTNGDNAYKAGRIDHTLTHDVYTRYYSNINFKANGGQMRISWNDFGTTRLLSVKYVYTLEERDRWLLFRCTEGGDADL